jgi:protease-4
MKEKTIQIFKIILLVGIVLTLMMYWYDQYMYYFTDAYSFEESSFIECPLDSNVALISIHGEIATYSYYSEELEDSDMVSSEEIVKYIDAIEDNEYMEALIVEIDSYGGYPVASEEIMNSLKRMKKPVIALIRGGAASGAYLIATGADKIYASEMSDIGGIGVTMSYLDYSERNKEEGLIYQQLSSSKFKDSGDPDKELTEEEKELYMRDLNILHDIFVKRVAENRNLDIEKVQELADGSTMLGQAAKDNGLIDEIGDIYDVKEWIKEELGIEPIICNY